MDKTVKLTLVFLSKGQKKKFLKKTLISNMTVV